MHSTSLQPCADHLLAAALHYPGRRAESLRLELRIAQALSIAVQVLETSSGLRTAVRMATYGPQQIGKTAAIEFLLPPLGPALGRLGIGAIEDFGEVAQACLDVKPVRDLSGAGQ